MFDGFGLDYLEKSDMPHLKDMMRSGFFKPVKGVFPSVTNVNNVSICCGAWPEQHGITGNSYFDAATGRAEYMNSADMIRTETMFQRAARHGVRSALLTSKRKTVELFHKGTETAIAAEDPPEAYVTRYGSPGSIYSREINYWLWRVAVDMLKNRPDVGLLYVHITDYPMHTWAPEEKESLEHLSALDELVGRAREVAPDAAFFITADHGMNYKNRCWDLTRVCREAGISVRFVLSPERDYYVVHHRNFTGCAWVWLHGPEDAGRVSEIIRGLEGVEGVLTRDEAAQQYHLVPERVGDLTVLGDRDTMFGDMDTVYEELPPTYRAHGSLHEMDLPLLIHNFDGELPPPDAFSANKDLAPFLY
jgi:phosphonoacetate hydrolase